MPEIVGVLGFPNGEQVGSAHIGAFLRALDTTPAAPPKP